MEQLQTITNYLTTVDENNKPMIDPVYYQNIITDHIETYLQENNLDRTKLTNNIMIAICMGIYETVFSNHTERTTPTNPTPRCNIPYTNYNINTLLEIYKATLIKYNCIPSLFGFSILTGIQEETTKKYVTPAGLEMTNLRRELLRNLLADDKTGRIVLANNDASFGLEYEKKQSLERETIRQGLSVGELPKFD